MTRTYEWIIAGIILLGVFAAGRYTAPTKTITQTKTVEVEKVVTVYVDKVNRTTTTTKKPDGTTTTVTIDKSVIDTNTNTDLNKTTDEKKEVDYSKSATGINFMIGVDVTKLTAGFVPGIQYSRRILGPIEAGAYGLSNGQIGLTVGFRF